MEPKKNDMKQHLWGRVKKDFKITWFSGTGSGGQHRNRHMNAVHMTDKETGIQTTSQTYKSAQQNLRSAFRKMVTLLEQYYKNEEAKRRITADFGQPRIRTYNECDDRVVDDQFGDQYSFKHTVSKGNIDKVIEQRRIRTLTETSRKG